MRVVLGVSGGIAAYKACEVVRLLERAGADVRVVLTANATRFVSPLTFQALSHRPVLLDPFDPHSEEGIEHLGLARELDVFAVAPATANVVAKLARGVADDLLTTLYLAVTCPVVIAPAMNPRMWLHPATQANAALLRGRGVRFVGPDEGPMAERESGWGRLAEPAVIAEAVLEAARRGRELEGRTFLVTAGPTREPLDPVRFLSNRSSGKMGYALAEAARRRGARVVLVSGPVALAPPYGVERLEVETAAEMRDAVLARAPEADAVLMAAAVADFAPAPRPHKIKKNSGPATLTLEPTPDILSELARRPRRGLLVGFAAETERLVENARAKLESKGVDFIVANDVSQPGLGMEAEENAVVILDRWGGVHEVPRAPKGAVAEAILDRVAERLR